NKMFMITGRTEDTYLRTEEAGNVSWQSASSEEEAGSLDKQWTEQTGNMEHLPDRQGIINHEHQKGKSNQQQFLHVDEEPKWAENANNTEFRLDGSDTHGSSDQERQEDSAHQAHNGESPRDENTSGQGGGEKEQLEEILSEEDIHIFLENEQTISSSQEVRESLVPRMRMLFDTDKEAFEFYNTYASVCGFSAKKASNYHSRRMNVDKPTRYTFKCNRSGKVVDKQKQAEKRRAKQIKRAEEKVVQGLQLQKKRKRNLLEVTDCKAQMVVSLRAGKWEIITLELDHNHELSPPDEARFLRSHKQMTEEEKLIIRTFNAVKLPTRKIMSILASYRGGIKAVPYNKKYVSNYRTAIRKVNSKNDMMQVSDYFRKRQAQDPTFYCAIKLDKNSTVESLFWADGKARQLYEAYENETIETFKWLFETFIHCMNDKQPVSIITDQDGIFPTDVAMKQAICQVFTSATHRNFLWHIKKKAEDRCAKAFASKKYLHEEFNDILNNSLTEEEFEDLWTRMIDKYVVQDLKYLQDMWLDRRRFVPVYYKNVFFPFINSTARSEGTNAIFKDNVCSTYSVISFLGEYQTIAENIEEKEKELDHKWEIEAGKAYNRAIFYKFQKQLRFTENMHIEEVVRFEKYEVYKSNYHAKMEFRSRRYIVAVDIKNEGFACLCCKFQKDGILCAHILKVLVHLNIPRILDKCIIQRWRPRDRKCLCTRQPPPSYAPGSMREIQHTLALVHIHK
ncbi:hypothetical protein BRADI_1g43021v3, partial [Brachypodium distachyon]